MVKRRVAPTKLPSRAAIYDKLDVFTGTVEEWLDEKMLLDAEFLADEGMFEHVTRAEYIVDEEDDG